MFLETFFSCLVSKNVNKQFIKVRFVPFMKMDVWINDISRVTRHIKTSFHNEWHGKSKSFHNEWRGKSKSFHHERRGEAESQVMKWFGFAKSRVMKWCFDLPSHEWYIIYPNIHFHKYHIKKITSSWTGFKL